MCRVVSLKELRKALLNRVGEKVKVYGFKKAAGPHFIKKAPPGGYALHLTFINHPDDFDVTADVAVRFDDVEDLLNEHKDFLTPKQKRETFSLGVELGNLVEGKPRRWTVVDAGDIEGVADSIAAAFVNIGLPYMEKYSDPEQALAVFSGEDRDSWLHSPFDHERAKRAIALALLTKGPERFNEIAVAKTNYLAAKNDPGLQQFLTLRAALEKRINAQNDNPTN
jgi:hypothetical protein